MDVDEGVAIRELKRFVAEHPENMDLPAKRVSQEKERIAVIGSGPSGMSAALELARKGYRPCIFEKENRAGGIPAIAIPEYRMPRTILRQDVNWILGHGIELKTGVRIGKDITLKELHDSGFSAVIIAVGMGLGKIPPLPGVEHSRVFSALDFLKSFLSKKTVGFGQDVLVIGGGSVAIDVAQVALRSGGDRVRMLCLENRQEMPAHRNEIQEAEEEGIEIIHRRSPAAVLTDNTGRLTGLRHQKVISVFDAQGNFNPSIEPDSAEEISCDAVIFAIGQAVNPDFTKGSGLKFDERHRLLFDRSTRQTNIDWIFACGEVVTPPGSVVGACANGQQTARAVDQFLQTGKVPPQEALPEPVGSINSETAAKVSKKKRVPLRLRLPEERKSDFVPYVHPLFEQQAVDEARRCMSCGSGAVIDRDQCVKCLNCVRLCPYGAPQIDGGVSIAPEHCQVCGICFSQCPVKAIEMHNGETARVNQEIADKLAALNAPHRPKILVYITVREMPLAACRGQVSAHGIDNCAEIFLKHPGQLEEIQLLKPFEMGADAVFVILPDDTQEYHQGTCKRLRKKIARLRADLQAIGMNQEQLQLMQLTKHQEGQVNDLLRQGIEKLEISNRKKAPLE